jgi:broad specificity phosphatase PhoE
LNYSLFERHFVRHAEGVHNVAGSISYDNYKLEEFYDAVLTENGINQCKNLSKKCLESRVLDDIDLLVVSPMRRTLQTASFAFPGLLSKANWIALDEIREQTGLHPCDRRHPISQLSRGFGHVDFSFVAADHDPLYGLYNNVREPEEAVCERAKNFLRWLEAREEKNIIVVTHSGFLKVLFDQVLDVDHEERIFYSNCELRSYRFKMIKDSK